MTGGLALYWSGTLLSASTKPNLGRRGGGGGGGRGRTGGGRGGRSGG